jgi:hypothetical protein
MALVTKRDKATDTKYKTAIGVRPAETNREFELEDVIEDLRDDVNSVIDLANKVDDFTFGFVAAKGKVKAQLVITHTKTSTVFTISA